MTSDATELRRALTPFRDRPMSVHEAESRRARIVAALRQQIRDLPRQRRTRRRVQSLAATAVGVGAAAALFALWRVGAGDAGTARPPAPAMKLEQLVGVVQLDEPSGTRRLTRGSELSLPLAGQLRVEQGGSAELKTARGLALSLGEASVASLGELGQGAQGRLKLLAGEVTCQVPRLGQGESFAVVTPSARVVVHGTVFKVRVNEAAADGGDTCVEVSEGAVIVHHAGGQVALNSGDSWGCEPKQRSSESRERAAVERPPAAREAAEVRKAGTLEPELRLLQKALIAERSGDKAAAERSLTQLLRKYPHSPLSAEARGVLARVRPSR